MPVQTDRVEEDDGRRGRYGYAFVPVAFLLGIDIMVLGLTEVLDLAHEMPTPVGQIAFLALVLLAPLVTFLLVEEPTEEQIWSLLRSRVGGLAWLYVVQSAFVALWASVYLWPTGY